jgi:flagellar assembly protein FliH
MSSRLYLPDDEQRASAMAWRKIDAAGRSWSAPGEGAGDGQAQLAQSERQWEQKVREARAAALKEGEAAGRSRAAAEVQPVLERLARSIEEVGQLRGRLRREAEADLVRLSLAIARRVLRRELAVDPDALHGLVLGALEKLQGQEICRVRVHPAHAAQVTQYLARPGTGSQIEVIADGSRDAGSVVFETQRGNLDASVETQLQEIERGLADRLRQHT